MSNTLRPTLGDFSSIVCFKSVVVGMEAALGEKTAAVGLIAAGRKRGQAVASSGTMSVTVGSPRVMVPVLSKTTVDSFSARSRTSPPRIRMP